MNKTIKTPPDYLLIDWIAFSTMVMTLQMDAVTTKMENVSRATEFRIRCRMGFGVADGMHYVRWTQLLKQGTNALPSVLKAQQSDGINGSGSGSGASTPQRLRKDTM